MEAHEAAIVKRFNDVSELFDKAFEMYQAKACQCAFPRYLQLVGIDCGKMYASFKCFDTEMLIGKSKPFFDVEKSDRSDECTNEKWICKTCKSVFEFGWQDFSIQVERQKLELVELKVVSIGKAIQKPIPLFLGLSGHSYPSRAEMAPATFQELEDYILER